ncbi:MAG TPA: hypothetical protein VG841_06215 [Caulobacterales bacterium]|nr:hypothetical protein [Caulobacterales bacterium]
MRVVALITLLPHRFLGKTFFLSTHMRDALNRRSRFSSPTPGNRRDMRVKDLIDKFEEANPRGRRSGKPMDKRTKRYMLVRLRHHVVPILGSKQVKEVSVAAVSFGEP